MYISHAHKILYMPVPKSGCTTIKKLLWFMESGFPPSGAIHTANPTMSFKDLRPILDMNPIKSYFKFCVVRDPIDRLLSAYNHRVLALQELRDSVFLQNRNFNLSPSFNQFVKGLEDYMKVPVIEHHVKPMWNFLGEDPSFYVRIYNMKEINTEIIPLLESTCGHSLKMDMSVNASPHVAVREDIPEWVENKIRKFYKKDYDLYGKYIK